MRDTMVYLLKALETFIVSYIPVPIRIGEKIPLPAKLYRTSCIFRIWMSHCYLQFVYIILSYSEAVFFLNGPRVRCSIVSFCSSAGKNVFSKKWIVYKTQQLNKYKKKSYKTTANLLTGRAEPVLLLIN